MRPGSVPAALLCVALGLALAFSRSNARAASLLTLLATLGVFSFLPAPRAWLDGVFLGCWLAVIATLASVYRRRELGLVAALVLSVDAGIWATAVLSVSGSRLDLLKAVPCSLVVVPASCVVRRYGSVSVKVVSSWIIAIAVLAITLQFIPVTPGYQPDHLE